MEKYVVSIAVDGRIDVEVSVPEGADRDQIKEAALNAFMNETDISDMEVVGSSAVNASNGNGDLLFDF